MRIALGTAAALVAFAGNSLLTRLALGAASIDASTFVVLRLVAGAGSLLVIDGLTGSGWRRPGGSWSSSVALFLYAVPFTFAYVALSAGTGALILFAAVQITMMIAALAGGARPHALQWAGLALAAGGLVHLVRPGLAAPPFAAAAAMAGAGVSWGVYSLRGGGSTDPLHDTTGNFVRAAPMAVVLGLAIPVARHISARGVWLALASGAVTSGIGYVIWYAVVKELGRFRAAIVQLAVPLLAACGGVVLLGEPFTVRIGVASVLIVGGVTTAVLGGRVFARHDGPSAAGRPGERM